MNLNEILGTVATDLKLANILTDLMPSSSSHPCTWCDSFMNELHVCGLYRTVKNCTENYLNWCNSGKLKKNAKNFMNCINVPVFSKDEDVLVLEVVPPPELHLLLEAVNTLFFHMQKENEQVCLQWAEKCNVQRQCTYGSPTFAGNACKTLLEKVDILDSFKYLELAKFVDTFRKLKEVVDSCFSLIIHPNFENSIEEFKKVILLLRFQ